MGKQRKLNKGKITTFYIDDELLRPFREKCKEYNVSMSHILSESIENFLQWVDTKENEGHKKSSLKKLIISKNSELREDIFRARKAIKKKDHDKATEIMEMIEKNTELIEKLKLLDKIYEGDE